ncbi:MAG: hypothetical protein ACRDQW_11145 [Haloechinothrix sp.]
MNRRHMLKASVAAAAAWGARGLPAAGADVSPDTNTAQAGTPAGAGRGGGQISTAQLAARGKWQSAVVPDTLDLTDRATIVLHPLLEYANSRDIDPRITTDRNTCGPKYLEALAFTRTMTGSEERLDSERQIMEGYLAEIADDGLFFVPAQGPIDEPWANILGQGRMMLAWMAWHARDGDERWLRYAERMARGIESITLYKDGYAYYPTETIFDARYVFCYRKSGWKVKEEPPPVCLLRPDQRPDMGDRDGHQVDARMGIHAYASGPLRPFARWSRDTHDTRTLEHARKLSAYLSLPALWVAFGEPNDVGGALRAHYSGHLHAHTMTLRGLLQYAMVTRDTAMIDFCRSGYEYTRNFGISRFGYVPEWTNNNLCEGCQIADVVALAIRLSDAGAGDYWDDVDGYARNHLIEQQHTNRTNKHFGKFCAGTYPTHLRIDDYAGCCTANCSDALYYVWESIVRHSDRLSNVNLLLNRASTWLNVDSYLPYEGKVVLHIKVAQALSVRLPTWVDRDRVQVYGRKGAIRPAWIGQRMLIDRVAPADEITIEFPVTETVEKHRIPGGANEKTEVFGLQPASPSTGVARERADWKGTWYTCRFRANTLVAIEAERPLASLAAVRGGVAPLYVRASLRQPKAPLLRKNRFVPDKVLDW